MYVFNSEMHVLTFAFLVLQLIMFTFQLWYYLSWPQDKGRLWYLILLGLLIVYDLTGGFFPDPNITLISVRLQNIIAYGSGFLMASYFPYYFYRAFELKKLRLHALYGVYIFLLFPYLVFFVVIYAINGNLESAIKYGMVVPFFYSLVILLAILSAIRYKFKVEYTISYSYGRWEILAVYCAVLPWASLTIISWFHITQWIEVLVTNLGFILITILFMVRSVRNTRLELERLIALDERQRSDFTLKCRYYGLTKRQIDVAAVLCRGMTYKEIAETLFIAGKTVDAHVQNIFLKTGANNKIELQQKLSYYG